MHAAVFVTPIPRPHGGCCLRGSHSLTSRVLCSLLTCGPFIESSALPGHPSPSLPYDVDWGVKRYTVSPAHSAHDSINDQNIQFAKHTTK
jgi:hypothetical protein